MMDTRLVGETLVTSTFLESPDDPTGNDLYKGRISDFLSDPNYPLPHLGSLLAEGSNLTLCPAHNYANDPDGMKTFRLSDLKETNRPIYNSKAKKKGRKGGEAQDPESGSARAPGVQRDVTAGQSNDVDEATTPIVDQDDTEDSNHLESPKYQPCHVTSCLYPHSQYAHAWRFNDHALQRSAADFNFNSDASDDAGNYIDPRYLEMSGNSRRYTQASQNSSLGPGPNVATSVPDRNSLSARNVDNRVFNSAARTVASQPCDEHKSATQDDDELGDCGIGK